MIMLLTTTAKIFYKYVKTPIFAFWMVELEEILLETLHFIVNWELVLLTTSFVISLSLNWSIILLLEAQHTCQITAN